MITKARNPKVWSKAQYFDIQKNWRKLSPIFKSDEARSVWHPCIEEFMTMRGEDSGYKHKPKPDALYPRDYESCDWYMMEGRGREPQFRLYARHSACHWVVDLALFVAKTAFPKIPWRILTGKKHTTVWNGCVDSPVLFDINFLALGVPASDAMEMASKGRELKPHKYLKSYLHPSP